MAAGGNLTDAGRTGQAPLELWTGKEKMDMTFLDELTSDRLVRGRPTCNKWDAGRSHTQAKVLLDFDASAW